MALTEDEIAQIADRDHADPHHILGAHPARSGVRVRAFRPEARSVVVRPDDEAAGAPTKLRRRDARGLFEGVVKGATLPLRYELEVSYPDGNSFRLRDPYSFPPTLGDLDLHLISEGRHERLYDRLGAHPRELEGVAGTAFAVWAPAARAVSVVGDFNSWDGRIHAMRSLGSSGVWELFVPEVGPGALYKFEIRTQAGERLLKADPLAFAAEVPPGTNSVVHAPRHRWRDGDWLARRGERPMLEGPVSIYEVHLGSWRLNPLEHNRPLSYRELADELAAYVTDLGFTHVELLPVMAHPFSGSWGYQVTSYYAPSPRFGEPDDFRAFVDGMHSHGIGVLLDWVPAHFPRDDWALARYDGSALYEHVDPRRGAHPDWGTLVFNFSRKEVRNFLIANALFWLREYHVDGIRVDAVASMLYRDYSRKPGEWIPNEFGGREDLDAVAFLKELNEVLYGREPGIVTVAEESTAWPGVSRPTYLGGLGFGAKWNMGWMHDTLAYFEREPIHRRFHHHELTFSLLYAFSENFILPLSHDEVVHGKGSLIAKMPGDRWQKLANLRSLFGYMWAHPGKKLLFMGQEFAQEAEWSEARSLDWHLLESAENAAIQSLVRDLNRLYREEPALWSEDFSSDGFLWIEPNDAAANVVAFARTAPRAERVVVCVANLSPVVREGYRLGLPRGGRWRELLNTDSRHYGGGDVGNAGALEAEAHPWNDQPHSVVLTVPPLGVLWLAPEDQRSERGA
ncbi:MAG TPA: 1,4-alpha-glucan branching protein GlgB [Solirubrobacteraceae bacterium]